MDTITINENQLTHKNIDTINHKVRAILVQSDKILVSNYGGIILLPGGSIDVNETPDEAIIRELEEETGIIYSIDNLEKLFLLNHYQANYKTRDNEVINRLISTYFYLGNFKGIDETSIKKTEKEKKDNFYLELIEIKDLLERIKKYNDNPRKPFFDKEITEAIKVYQKVLIKKH